MTPHLKKDPHNEPTNRTVGNKLYIEARPDDGHFQVRPSLRLEDSRQNSGSTDFLSEKDGKRIAQECKLNIGRDTEKTEAICELLAKQLDAIVHIVVPYPVTSISRILNTRIASATDVVSTYQQNT